MPWGLDRPWTDTKKLRSTEPGTILKSIRAFGVEIECQDRGHNLPSVVNDIDKNIGIGGDGSINGGCGVEIRTPPASGKAGEDMMKTLCGSLYARGFSVDSSCGLHVHIDASDMKAAQAKEDGWKCAQLYWMFYIAMDSVIRSFLPSHRRTNHFCKSMEPVFTAVGNADSLGDLMDIFHSSSNELLDSKARARGTVYKDPTRYRGINLTTLWNGWHPEVRYHNGTIQANRILHWAYLHCLIMDKIMDGTITREWIVRMYSKRSISNKTTALFSILGINKPTEIYLKARQAIYYRNYVMFHTSEVADQYKLLEANTY